MTIGVYTIHVMIIAHSVVIGSVMVVPIVSIVITIAGGIIV